MAETILEVRNLSVAFRKSRKDWLTAVNDVSFTLAPGEVLGIVGESGCGKSVTASSILGLLPRDQGKISGGEILYGGQDLTKLRPKELRRIRGREIAMIFQDPLASLNPVKRIGWQMIEMLQANEKISHKAAWAASVEMLRKVGIPDPEERMRAYPFELSGGMIQRVMIAMALSVHPRILIADEPTTALDVTVQAQVLALMEQLREDTGMSIILITHDMGVVAEMARNVIVMYAGEFVEKAPIRDLLEAPRHPYTRGLLRAIPRLDTDVEYLEAIEGTVPPMGEMEGCRFAPRCKECMEVCRRKKPPVTGSESQAVRCWKYAEGEDNG